VIVGRIYSPHEYDPNNAALNPLAAALQHCNVVVPHADRMGGAYSFWQGINEPVLNSEDAMKRYSDFEAERVRIMNYFGYKVVVGSFSVGTPHFPYWKQFIPALDEAYNNGSALALHEYGWPALSYQSPWLLLRHRKVYEGEPSHGWEGLPDRLKNMPLYITESGWDRTLVGPPGGWRINYQDDPQTAISQLVWYHGELHDDPYVMASALYCAACGGNWATYNLYWEIIDYLARYAHPLYRTPSNAEPAKGIMKIVTCSDIAEIAPYTDIGEGNDELRQSAIELLDEISSDVISIRRIGDDIVVYVEG